MSAQGYTGIKLKVMHIYSVTKMMVKNKSILTFNTIKIVSYIGYFIHQSLKLGMYKEIIGRVYATFLFIFISKAEYNFRDFCLKDILTYTEIFSWILNCIGNGGIIILAILSR